MTPDKPIYSKESDELKKLFNKLIGRHNVLCSIEKVFAEDEVANRYFEEAREEVLDSGNQSLASMFVIAIENMAKFIYDHENEETDIDRLKHRIYDLESENRKLKRKLDNINEVVNKLLLS